MHSVWQCTKIDKLECKEISFEYHRFVSLFLFRKQVFVSFCTWLLYHPQIFLFWLNLCYILCCCFSKLPLLCFHSLSRFTSDVRSVLSRNLHLHRLWWSYLSRPVSLLVTICFFTWLCPLSVSLSCAGTVILSSSWAPISHMDSSEEMLRENMGGQKGETHDEAAITNKLEANGEASIFFLVFFFPWKNRNSALQLLNSTCAWSVSEWMGEKASDSNFTFHFFWGKWIRERVVTTSHFISTYSPLPQCLRLSF